MKICRKCFSRAKAAFWIFSLVLAALCFWTPGSAAISYGAVPENGNGEKRVFDYAGIFGEDEAAMLEEKAAQLREEMNAEVIVLTVEDAEGKSAQEVADSFYFDQGFWEHYHENGILMLIDMDNRELYLGAYGSMIRILTDNRIERILDDVYEEASGGRYGAAALAGIQGAYGYFREGIQSNQYNYNVETGKISRYRSIRWYEALFALAASGAVAGLVCLGVVRQYHMEESPGAKDMLAYRADCRFSFHNPVDQLVNTSVTHMVIPRNPPGGRGGAGGSSGRSSTHSYGGHQAGGGGRKF